MNTTILKTKEQLQQDYNLLLEQLRNSNRKNTEAIILQMNENKAQVKELDKINLLKQVNAKYSRLRNMAKQAYDCELPTEDITNDNGYFHKTKVKKYPKIAALEYASAHWEKGMLTNIRINGEKFNMFRIKYEYGKEDIYTRPETFADFLELNIIPSEDITIEQYNEFSSKLKALNDKLKADIESYDKGLKSINTSRLNYYGLVDQRNTNLYEYTTKY